MAGGGSVNWSQECSGLAGRLVASAAPPQRTLGSRDAHRRPMQGPMRQAVHGCPWVCAVPLAPDGSRGRSQAPAPVFCGSRAGGGTGRPAPQRRRRKQRRNVVARSGQCPACLAGRSGRCRFGNGRSRSRSCKAPPSKRARRRRAAACPAAIPRTAGPAGPAFVGGMPIPGRPAPTAAHARRLASPQFAAPPARRAMSGAGPKGPPLRIGPRCRAGAARAPRAPRGTSGGTARAGRPPSHCRWPSAGPA